MKCYNPAGREIPIVDAIVHVLRYIKQCTIAELNKTQRCDINEREIQWVLTVPAIWTDAAKVRPCLARRKSSLSQVRRTCPPEAMRAR